MAVHPVYRKAVWIEAELVVRRPPRRRLLDSRRARVSLEASPGLRRRPTARGCRLQLGGRQRQAVDVPKPRTRKTDGRLVAEAPEGNAGSRVPAARIRGHRQGTRQIWRGPRTDSRPCAIRIRAARRSDRPRCRSGPGQYHAHRDLPVQFRASSEELPPRTVHTGCSFPPMPSRHFERTSRICRSKSECAGPVTGLCVETPSEPSPGDTGPPSRS